MTTLKMTLMIEQCMIRVKHRFYQISILVE